LIAR
jgi:NAD(P)-dependent dehydrogenase (short-subunit alcohol dehydrogenase family)